MIIVMKTYNIEKGVDVRVIKAEKFKTNLITMYMAFDVSRENITKAAVLSQVLTRGTEKYKTLTEISKREEELYGATVRCEIKRKGETQVFGISIGFPSEKFLDENINKDILELLYEVVFCPLTENGGFVSEYVNQEKENVKNYIASIINDKRTYAKIKCIEHMFSGEIYGVSEYGYIEDLPSINEKNLYEFYKEMINNSKIEVFVSGNFDEEEIVADIKTDLLSKVGARNADYKKCEISKKIEEKNIVEEMDVSQSKLCLGLKTNISMFDDEYYALKLCNSILGGSPFSKLFNNVREKLSLAYYVSSSLIGSKGVMLISSGIETKNYEMAYNEIFVQLENIKNGVIDDFEITSAVKYIRTGLNSVKDSLKGIEDYMYSGLVLGKLETVDELLSRLERVTKEEIINAAKKIELDTVYFLKGVECAEEV